MVNRKKKRGKAVDPDFLDRQKASMVRSHRQVICLNDKELEAVNEYCRRFRIKSRAGIFREAGMEKILSAMEENHPTLF